MKYIVDTTPYIGARYSALERTFEITGLPLVEGDQWVEYYNENTKQTYSCRLEAFLARFSMLP